MDDEQFAILITAIQKQTDILMMLLRASDPLAAATVDHVHNDLEMYMHEDWEAVEAAQQAMKEIGQM